MQVGGTAEHIKMIVAPERELGTVENWCLEEKELCILGDG